MILNNKNNTAFSKLSLMCAAMVFFCLSFSISNSQIREDSKETAEKLDALKIQIEEATEKAEALEKQTAQAREEVAEIQQELINSAADIQKTEGNIIQSEANLKNLLEREDDLEGRLRDKNFEMASTLGAMQRLSLQKTSIVAFKPDDAVDTLRTTSLLRVILPDLKNRADLLQNDLTELNDVRYEITDQNTLLKKQLTTLVISNGEIDDLLKQRVVRQKELEKTTEEERKKLRQFAENAKNLQELVDQIEIEIALRDEAAQRAESFMRDKPTGKPQSTVIATAPVPSTGLGFEKSKGNLPLPARGNISQSFNQLLASGQRHKGITVDTRVGATVIAPHEGRVVFAGKFRTYGELLIISHGDGYHTLLAGMEKINSIVGQWVLKGEPVGQMSKTAGPSNSRQKLYVELRQKGKPVNPLPWIIAMDRG
ncbi:MAG: peptidoglycan DD-metalloendopeptidase family protein [Emcibacteraceae bacterium]|nr:peptidoglycan DD-metalloendopeptidase family protein [Emcibacteraceae bacterium]